MPKYIREYEIQKNEYCGTRKTEITKSKQANQIKKRAGCYS
jgi:hypothetical protein